MVNIDVQLAAEPDLPSVVHSDSDDQDTEELSLAENLTNWAIHFGITLVAVTALLAILKIHHPELRKDAGGLLKTRQTTAVEEKAGGHYFYFCILEAFRQILTDVVSSISDKACLKLQINIDGLQLFKAQIFNYGQYLVCYLEVK